MTKPKAMHYMFYPSQNDRNADPLIVWFAGTPGCSSLLTAFYDIGPFIFLPGRMTFTRNENAWNKKANLLFLEIPAGTGFSDGPT
jgi:carboxypeptidase C (cathepsin A)